MSMKLGMDHRGLKVYKVSINDDPGLTLTYLKAKSNLLKITYCAGIRLRCQVSAYRTFGPLVCHLLIFFSE